MAEEKPNIILIVCDSLRKDIIETYNGRAKTPNLKKLAKDAMVYDNAIAPSPWTFPSHVSLFTGLYPSEHGVHETSEHKTSELIEKNHNLNKMRLAEYLKELGYNTFGISNNYIVSRFTNFDIGFDYFFNIEADPKAQSEEIKNLSKEVGGSPIQIANFMIKNMDLDKAKKYLKAYIKLKFLYIANNYPVDKGARLTTDILKDTKLSKPFFLFINLFEMHEPYVGHHGHQILDHMSGIKEISDKKAKSLKKQYIFEAEYLDANIGKLINTLKERGLYENTVLIITSDHGQAFKEHGFMYHGMELFDEIIRIPLIIKYPHNKKFKKISGYQSLKDIFYLTLDLANNKNTDKTLTKEFVFSETYSNSWKIPKSYERRMNYIKKHYDKTKKAIYYNGFKLVVDGTNSKYLEFTYMGNECNKQKEKKIKLLKLLKIFNTDSDFKLNNLY